MPFDYLSVRRQAAKMAEWEQAHQENKQKIRNEAFKIFQSHAGELNGLKSLVGKARSYNPNLRCALPVNERLDFSYISAGLPEEAVLVAADGSQVFPDRNDPLDFGLVNIGALRFELTNLTDPKEYRESTLLYAEKLHDPLGNPVGEDFLGLERDYQEREFLSRLVDQEALPVVALTDGPLEFHREPRLSSDYQGYLEKYLGILQRLSEKKAGIAGYVDRPRSDLVVRLLEVVHLGEENMAEAGRVRPFISLSDADLFSKILPPGSRSAVFGLQSPSAENFKGQLALHFFYLNVGRPGQAELARVEIPFWVANQPEILNRIHAVLVNQCKQMGAKPYPYILHRAHEIALIKQIDKADIIRIISDEYLRRGIPVGTISNKQFHKDSGNLRTRDKL